MKIAFINQPWGIAEPQPVGDSINIWTYNVARHLSESHDVFVYGVNRGFSQKTVRTYAGIQYRGFTVRLDRLVLNKALSKLNSFLKKIGASKSQDPFVTSDWFHLSYFYQVAADLRSQQYDVIHIHNFSQFLPLVRAFNPQAKIILHMHCEWLSQFDYATLESRLECADLIVACSDHVTGKISNRFPHLAQRCRTIFNGVDVAKFIEKGNGLSQENKLQADGDHSLSVKCSSEEQVESKKRTLLFVGRVSPEKGLHILLDAFKEVAQKFPDVILEIAGSEISAPREFVFGLSDEPDRLGFAEFYSGSYLEKLKLRVSPEIKDRVSFVGYVSHDELPVYYKRAEILINPSLSEAFGMSLVEGMATGIPVIGARIGGMTSVIEEGKTGFLVEPNDPSALADAICYLLANDELRQSMGEAGRQRVLDLFSWGKVAESLEIQYEKLFAFRSSMLGNELSAVVP